MKILTDLVVNHKKFLNLFFIINKKYINFLDIFKISKIFLINQDKLIDDFITFAKSNNNNKIIYNFFIKFLELSNDKKEIIKYLQNFINTNQIFLENLFNFLFPKEKLPISILLKLINIIADPGNKLLPILYELYI